ncbi:MFS transporter [Loigolactobacillus coryniformis]|uniref:MFS transporter n=1 Tax=Loigolactobacillus coryniformis TaxID=1610 RepID=UPI001C5E5826|nr:MFS transporter [Loigolactobacillus coryniformis]MBW4803584.1 MFS transporter [Loigolactobacillus coryniformis subsp. torquens]MBW4806289.1 MFS transporter [Loigolactobacillus coryniformis subsp. torquens]
MKQRNKLALIVFIVGVFMSALDNGIISSALTTINYAFHVSTVQGTWGITLYTLGIAVTTPIAGKLADKYGRRRLFLIEITLFAFGSLLVALSPSFSFFLIARVVQSLGGGGIFIIASSYILATYTPAQQGGLLGALGAVNGIASVVGPNLGSLVLNLTGSWHWLFLINLPIAVIVVISGWLVIPETKNELVKALDYKGLLVLTLGILSLMLAITNIEAGSLLASLEQSKVWGLMLLSGLLFSLFIQLEKRVSARVDPFLPYNLLRSRGFGLTLFMGLLTGALIAIFVFIPSFVEQRYGVTANNSGIGMSAIGLGAIIGAGVGGGLVTKLGASRTIVISGILATLGFALIAFLSPNLGWFIVNSGLTGIGFGMLMGAPLSVLMSQIAPATDNGVALGTLSVSRQVGLTLAPTFYATIVQNRFGSLIGAQTVETFYRHLSSAAQLQSFQQVAQLAYRNMFSLAVGAAGLILLSGFYLQRRGL